MHILYLYFFFFIIIFIIFFFPNHNFEVQLDLVDVHREGSRVVGESTELSLFSFCSLSHCESFCKLRGVKSWVAATVHLPREIDAPGAVVIRDNSETDVAFLPKIAELRLRKLEEKASKASKESSESEKKKHKNADKEPLLQGMDAQKVHKGDIKVDQTCAFGQYSTFDLEEKVENSKEEIGEGESFEFKGGDVPPCKDPRIATTFCSKVCECLRGFFELLAVISFFFILSSCAIPAYHYAKWAADLPSPWGYIHLGIYNVDSPLDNSEGFDMCTAKTFGILLSQMVTIWAFTFTVAVIVLKWLIVGQYKPGNVRVASLAWYRWWYVDRLQGIWETFIGPFLLDTCLATVFYKLMGADIAWSATVETFIREADLVVVGSHATVSGILMTRLFVDSEEMVTAVLRTETETETETERRHIKNHLIFAQIQALGNKFGLFWTLIFEIFAFCLRMRC